MRERGLKFIAILFGLLVFAIAPAALADSAQDLVDRGNRLYDNGNFNDAIQEYDQALIDQPQTLEPKFNQANCYFKLDDLAKAIDLYNEVAAESKDMGLVAKAKYNLGNSYFQRGTKQKDSDLQKALEDLQTSIMCWRGALDIDPENENAAKNIEVARLTIKDIIDQINKQKQEQEKQAAKQKQMQEQLKEILEKQKALAGQTEETKKQEDNKQIDKQQASENYNKQAEQQSQLQSQTEQTSQQTQQQQDPNSPVPPQVRQAAEELNKAADKQKDAEKQLNAADGTSAKQSQDEAVEHLENAMKALSGDNQQNQQQQQQQQEQQSRQNQQDPNEVQQQQQQAMAPDTTADDILNKEQREKKQRQILQGSGYQKVDKDW